MKTNSSIRLVTFLTLFAVSAARAACTIDFEDLALGTTVTTQYVGVTFSIGNQGLGPVYMRIQNPEFGTTSSGTKCLKITAGAGDFSSEFLVMVFDLPQTRVSFTLGDLETSYLIRYYTDPAGGTPSGPVLSVSAGSGVRTLVTVNGTGIRRIEVESDPRGNFEAIDDLSFDADLTPPLAEITSPAFMECVCSDTVVVRGRACEDASFYGRDWLEYKSVLGGDWTFIGSYSSPACDPGSWLYTWSTALIPEGSYLLRLSVTNKCGLRSEAFTAVTLHRSIDASQIRSPISHTILGGTVCIDGSAHDACFHHYAVEYALASGGGLLPVDWMHPIYTIPVANDPLASWDTANNSDGDYELSVTTFDACGHTASHLITVTLDNTAPIGRLSSPVQCSKWAGIIPIYGIAADAHLSGWVLQYTDPVTHGWTDIASGTSPVLNSLLANWDTTSLPACAYALRLVVTDQSKVNMDCSGNAGANQTIYMLTLDVVKSQLEQDTDGDGMSDIWETAHGFNPNDPSDAALDTDNDGVPNLAEFLAGTDPRDPNSNVRITAIARQAPDTSVTWTSSPGHSYLREEKSLWDNDVFSTVSPLLTVPPNGPATTTFTHRNATSPTGFYRVHVVR